MTSDFGFLEEVPEAASGILPRVRRHLQDELHHHRLVGHLLHQSFFLEAENQNPSSALSPTRGDKSDRTRRVLTATQSTLSGVLSLYPVLL